jgi:hypothetical protein
MTGIGSGIHEGTDLAAGVVTAGRGPGAQDRITTLVLGIRESICEVQNL